MRSRNSDKRCISRTWHGRVAAVLAVLALVVAQAGPLAARVLVGGAWIEICSEAGPVMVRVDLSGEEADERGECPACATCPFCAPPDTEAAAMFEVAVTRVKAARDRPTQGTQTLIANPARFWPDNRGPPVVQAMQPTGICMRARAPEPVAEGGLCR